MMMDTNKNTGGGDQLSIALDLIGQVHRDSTSSAQVIIDGQGLTIAQLIRLGHCPHQASIVKLSDDQATLDGLHASLQYMLARTTKSTYGVTTGFGAAATTRTDQVEALQISIIEHLLAGVTGFDLDRLSALQLNLAAIPVTQPIGPHLMSEAIVRGAILVRLNSLSRGHSAVRVELLERLLDLLNYAITPLVPLRGTISASGDLSPLAYIAGTICAHPDVFVLDRSLDPPQLLTCSDSLKRHGITPLVLGPKEGLAIANGTAFSASAAGIVIYQTHVLVLLSQVLTAMMAEAMLGQIGAFHPFIHQTARPHPGQMEVAKIIHTLLKSSQFIDHMDHLVEKDLELERFKQVLRQDRYPLRTAPQWLGPHIEDIVQIHHTITQELNSTTDNPLIDVRHGILHHGGNFQATAISNSMEKIRLSLAMIGKLMFAQLTELNNSSMNKGLPSCLNGSEPSTNYHTKGIDTASASYCAELQYLATPVTTHIQSAEGHNQSVNSLAFISARKSLESIEVLKLLMASHLYCLCQALDLRSIELEFKKRLKLILSEQLREEYKEAFSSLSNEAFEELTENVLEKFWMRRETNASLDARDRVRDSLEGAVWPIVQTIDRLQVTVPNQSLQRFLDRTIDAGEVMMNDLVDECAREPSIVSKQLGMTRGLYDFVRVELKVAFRKGDVGEGKIGKTVGSCVNKIVESFEVKGRMERVLMKTMGTM